MLNINLNNLYSYNTSNDNIDYKYLNEELKIKYDENILKEINEAENENHNKKNELEKDNNNEYNSMQIKEKKLYNSII